MATLKEYTWLADQAYAVTKNDKSELSSRWFGRWLTHTQKPPQPRYYYWGF